MESKDLIEVDMSNLPLTHTFSDNMYVRSGTMPKGSLVIGEKHKKKCMNIMSSGKMILWMDGVVQELVAPCIFESQAGSRKVGYMIENVVFSNIHITDKTNLDELREELVYNKPIEGLDKIKELICG
jgi:hypothetical protein